VADETWGCTNYADHPDADIGYHPLRGAICKQCGERIRLLKANW
jgi:hypothetical protein